MPHAMKRYDFRAEDGAIWALFAVLMPLILFIGILSVDVGNWWVHKRHLQTQVDAAALAAAPLFRGCFRNPPVANGDIAIEALKYAGDLRRDSTSLNRQVQEPGDVFVALNSSRYWQKSDTALQPTTGYLQDYGADGDPSTPGFDSSQPCDSRFLDVKATDDDVFPLWGRIPELALTFRSLFRPEHTRRSKRVTSSPSQGCCPGQSRKLNHVSLLLCS